jgi:DNA-binding transcriptional ArsR family regulator
MPITCRCSASNVNNYSRSANSPREVNFTGKHLLAYIRAVEMDKVFKALADSTRRRLLDSLRAEGGQTLLSLCRNLDMTRQAVTQHLGRLEDANLVATVRRGREKLHYLNPVPIHDIHERWIEKFERHHLDLLRDLKNKLEGDTRE